MLIGDPSMFAKATDIKPGTVFAETLEGVQCFAALVLIDFTTVRIMCRDLEDGLLATPSYLRIYRHDVMLVKLA